MSPSAPPRLESRPWMVAAPTRHVLGALAAKGQVVRFVGGCVRDGLLGRDVKDVDLATPDEPDQVIRLLEAAGIRVVPTGIRHGTVTAIAGPEHFEITTLRHDVETYGRHARVAFTDDWQADAARRDFTMNAMFADPDGTLHDFHGGYDDLVAGRVRFVGTARKRIEEDVLRLLRFYRFNAHYGRGEPDAEGREACRALAGRIPSLSMERVRDETLKLLRASAPHPVLALMAEDGVLAQFLPEASARDRLIRLIALEEGRTDADAIRRLAVLLDAGTDGGAVGVRLKLSNADRRRLDVLAGAVAAFEPPGDDPAIRRGFHRHGAALYRDMVMVAAAASPAPDAGLVDRVIAAAATWTPRRLPVGGGDVAALGVPAGPRTGDLLRALEAWWIEGDFRAGRDALLEQLERLARQ